MYSCYPTGVTIYDPDKCWNGFTLLDIRSDEGTPLIDMNGTVVKFWDGISGYPPRVLPGGQLIGSTGLRSGNWQDQIDIVQVDWDGNTVWEFNRWEEVGGIEGETQWMARQHHDWQREGSPAGYYAPGQEPKVSGGNTIVLAHSNLSNPDIHEKPLHDNVIYEVTWDGEIIWTWFTADHFHEMGFDDAAKTAIGKLHPERGPGYVDWHHANALSVLGPNPWFDTGDQRFHPENMMISSRMANIINIISKETGNLVWQLGPDFSKTPALKALGWIIGQHHPHMIPKGLPGEGNILVFDNGGASGYGQPSINSPDGINNVYRIGSRMIEFNPVTLEKVWEYSPEVLNYFFFKTYNFFSPYIGGAQRLANGNTLITMGADGRVIEVTPDLEIVWEYVSPYMSRPVQKGTQAYCSVYRAYRIPYEWIPRLNKPVERAVTPIPNSKFRVSV